MTGEPRRGCCRAARRRGHPGPAVPGQQRLSRSAAGEAQPRAQLPLPAERCRRRQGRAQGPELGRGSLRWVSSPAREQARAGVAVLTMREDPLEGQGRQAARLLELLTRTVQRPSATLGALLARRWQRPQLQLREAAQQLGTRGWLKAMPHAVRPRSTAPADQREKRQHLNLQPRGELLPPTQARALQQGRELGARLGPA